MMSNVKAGAWPQFKVRAIMLTIVYVSLLYLHEQLCDRQAIDTLCYPLAHCAPTQLERPWSMRLYSVVFVLFLCLVWLFECEVLVCRSAPVSFCLGLWERTRSVTYLNCIFHLLIYTYLCVVTEI